MMCAHVAAAAAALVVDEGMEYAAAKRKAARGWGGAPSVRLPRNEQLEDAVREHIAVFHADTQPPELHALRELALQWMQRLAPFRPAPGGRRLARHRDASVGAARSICTATTPRRPRSSC